MIDKLYETIGGNRTIWAATEAFYRRVLADPDLRPFFESVDMPHLVGRQSMFISMLLGGRIVYTGNDIASAHEHVRNLGLTKAHFDAFLSHFRAALIEVGVAGEKADEIIRLLEQRRAAVLKDGESSAAEG